MKVSFYVLNPILLFLSANGLAFPHFNEVGWWIIFILSCYSFWSYFYSSRLNKIIYHVLFLIIFLLSFSSIIFIYPVILTGLLSEPSYVLDVIFSYMVFLCMVVLNFKEARNAIEQKFNLSQKSNEKKVNNAHFYEKDRVVFASECTDERNGIGMELYRNGKLAMIIFRDDERKTRTVRLFGEISLDVVEQGIEIFKKEIPWDFISYKKDHFNS